MESLESVKGRIESAVDGVELEIIPNDSPAQQPSLLMDKTHAVAVATFLRDDPEYRFDYASNVTGVDYLDSTIKEKVMVTKEVDGETKEVTEVKETVVPGYLEAVYHLYSMELKQGPLILRLRTEDRLKKVELPSLTPVWRSAELQEREIFDLYGIKFTGHPDLRRLLMWDDFTEFPMRKDYVDPDDYEYEPTPHGEVLKRTQAHQSTATAS